MAMDCWMHASWPRLRASRAVDESRPGIDDAADTRYGDRAVDPNMDAFEHVVLSRGRYRLLALSSQPHSTCDAITGYAVDTLAGDRVRVEATLPLARAWLEAQVRREALVHPPPARLRR
jgi:hypothetical protein